MAASVDFLSITLFVAWVVAVVFAFSWYRKWGDWTSTPSSFLLLCIVLPVLVIRLGSNYSPDSASSGWWSRVFALSMTVRAR